MDKHTKSILMKVAESFGPANSPRTPENKDDHDFKAGYAEGRKNEDILLLHESHPIWLESEKRGFKITESDAAFDRWKQGYWSGRYLGTMQEILDTPDPEYDEFKRIERERV